MPSIVPAAPEPLETVRALVNTFDIEDGTEALATPADLQAWLSHRGLLEDSNTGTGRLVDRMTRGELARAVELREALRAALAANHDGTPVPDSATEVLNAAAERANLTVELTADAGWVARPKAEGVDGALGRVLAIVTAAMTEGTWRRLKICSNDACQWAFYDKSRARTGKWCSMQICGNRAKQQAWRTRHDT